MFISSAGEIVATAVASFSLGWTLKNFRFNSKLLNVPSRQKTTKMVLVVRPDLQMSKGKIAAQCSHAAVSCYRESLNFCPHVTKTWMADGEPKIVLISDSPGEENLRKLANKAAKCGLVAAMIRDAGHTQVLRGSATVLGIGPGPVTIIDQVTSHLKLL